MRKLILLFFSVLAFAGSIKAQVPTNQDCLGAIPICQNIYSNPVSYSGTGNYPTEINSFNSCLGSGELNDVWYQFTVQQSGNVCFSITPVSLSDDYDWAVYNLTNNNCADIYNNSALEVSCNYSGTAGVTGPNGQTGSQNNPCIPVTAGQTYVINVSNYSSTANGYTINFSASTAVIFDNVPPNILSVNQPIACGATSLTFTFSENVLCNTVANSDFTLTGPGGPYTLSGVTGAACAVGGTSENTFTINVSPSLTTSGNYSLNLVGSVTDLCGNAAPPGSLAFTINATAAPTASSPAPVCQGNPVPALTATGSNITWYSNSGLTTVAGTGSPWNSGATSSTSYWVTQTVGGCQSAATQVNITVNPLPTVTVSGAGPFCQSDPAVNLTGSPSGGTWSGTGITNTSAGTFDPSVAGLGNHTITYSYTDGNGCSASATTVVAVNAGGNPAINPAGPFCASDPATTLTAASGGGTWSGTGITNTSAGTFDPGVAGAGTHTITYTVPGSCGGTSMTSITVNPSPSPSVTAAGPFCTTDPAVNLTGSPSGGTWSGTGITNASAGTFNPSTAGAGTHTITYSLTSGGCTANATTNITVNSNANTTITPAGPFCADASAVNLTAAQGGGTWSGTGITDAVNGTFDPAVAGAGTHTITYTISGPCGSSSTATITVNAVPNSAITSSGPYCASDPAVNLTAATAGGTWSGQGITNTFNGTFDPSVAGIGTHTITYSVTILGCTSTSTASITVSSSMTASISAAPGPFCADDNAVNLTGAAAGGTWAGPGITDPVNGTFDPAVAGAGIHNITYTLSGACGDTDTIAITVNAVPAAPSSTSPLTYCSGNSIAPLTATGSGGTLTWYSQLTPLTVAGTGSPFNSGASSSATFWVTETVSGCEGPPTQVNIVINPTPTMSTGVVNHAACYDSSGSVIGVAVSNGTAPYFYIWTNSGGDTVSTSATSADLLNMPVGTYSLLVIDANGCSSASSWTANINTLTSISAGFTASAVSGLIPLVVNFTNQSTGANSYYWDFGDGNTSSVPDPANTYTSGGVFTAALIATDANGCSDTAMVTITVDALSLLTVPNVFSPNGDGKNDVFELAYQNITEFRGEIFNRWGEKIFEWTDIGTGWDGRSASGKEVPPGTYFYIVNAMGIDGKEFALRGTVTLLR